MIHVRLRVASSSLYIHKRLFQIFGTEFGQARKNRRKEPKHKKNWCTWYGQCKLGPPTTYNCYKPQKAKHLEDDEALEILKEYCPAIYGDGTNVKTCCNVDQLKNMKNNMEVPNMVSFYYLYRII